MYTTLDQKAGDSQTIMSRFYSLKSQGITFNGSQIENAFMPNTLSDPYSLATEKLQHLRAQFFRIHGREPFPHVMVYKGLHPGMEGDYNRQYNRGGERFTAETWAGLGELMYKGTTGLFGSRLEPLEQTNEFERRPDHAEDRFGAGDTIDHFVDTRYKRREAVEFLAGSESMSADGDSNYGAGSNISKNFGDTAGMRSQRGTDLLLYDASGPNLTLDGHDQTMWSGWYSGRTAAYDLPGLRYTDVDMLGYIGNFGGGSGLHHHNTPDRSD